VYRNGKFAYWTRALIAAQLCAAQYAKRADKGRIDLPEREATEDAEMKRALKDFAESKPPRLCYGEHSTPNKDRKRFAPCYFQAQTGQMSAHRTVSFREVG